MTKIRRSRPFVRAVNREKIVRMYNDHVPIDQMMKIFNLSRSGIYAALKKYAYSE